MSKPPSYLGLGLRTTALWQARRRSISVRITTLCSMSELENIIFDYKCFQTLKIFRPCIQIYFSRVVLILVIEF